MPRQHSQSGAGPYRNRGFSPLFRGPYSDQHLRVSDAERQAVTDRLAGSSATAAWTRPSSTSESAGP